MNRRKIANSYFRTISLLASDILRAHSRLSVSVYALLNFQDSSAIAAQVFIACSSNSCVVV